MTLKNKNLIAINGFLDRLSSSYNTDYDVLRGLIRDLNLTDANSQAHMDWCLVHLKTSLVSLHKDIKNMQDRLREIDK